MVDFRNALFIDIEMQINNTNETKKFNSILKEM